MVRTRGRRDLSPFGSVTSYSDFHEYVSKNDGISITAKDLITSVYEKMHKEPVQDEVKVEQRKDPAINGPIEPMSIYSKYFSKKPDIKATFNDIVANVHRTMITTPPRPVTPAVPAAIAAIPNTEAEAEFGAKRRNKKRRISGGQNRPGSINMTIPMAKANLDRKLQQGMRRGLKTSNGVNQDTTFTFQRRIHEVMKQKNVLQNMLMEHRKLQRDRMSIAMDIQRMRNDLDRIRQKLDMSLQSLKATQTFISKSGSATGKNNNNSMKLKSILRNNAVGTTAARVANRLTSGISFAKSAKPISGGTAPPPQSRQSFTVAKRSKIIRR